MKTFILAILLAGISCSSCAKVSTDHSCNKYSKGDFTLKVRNLPLVIEADNTFSPEWTAELQAAADIWNSAAKKQIIVIKKSNNKARVLNSWVRDNKGEQAFTRVHFIESGAITAAHIFVNGSNFKFYTNFSVGNEVHLRSLLVHELGHAIGIGHTNLSHSIMNPYLGANTERVKLTSYDKEALECLYGK